MNTVEVIAIGVALLAGAIDLKTSRIPNWLTGSAAAVAVLFHALSPDGQGVAAALGGLVVGLLVFFPIFALGAMGAGDVKLLAALGAWVGWYPVIYVALYGSIAGGVIGLLIALSRGYLVQALRNLAGLFGYWRSEGLKPRPSLTLQSPTAMRMPYAGAIAAGVVVTSWIA